MISIYHEIHLKFHNLHNLEWYISGVIDNNSLIQELLDLKPDWSGETKSLLSREKKREICRVYVQKFHHI